MQLKNLITAQNAPQVVNCTPCPWKDPSAQRLLCPALLCLSTIPHGCHSPLPGDLSGSITFWDHRHHLGSTEEAPLWPLTFKASLCPEALLIKLRLVSSCLTWSGTCCESPRRRMLVRLCVRLSPPPEIERAGAV